MTLTPEKIKKRHKFWGGAALEQLKTVQDGTYNAIVTSPPYWGLRDYGEGITLGAERTVDEYVQNIVTHARGFKRVLRDDGTFWLNIGDCYSGSWGNSGHRPEEDGVAGKQRAKNSMYLPRNGMPKVSKPSTVDGAGVPPKNLVGVPWRVAFALQADGWFLRGDIIWAKRNGMPSSVNDRPTSSHEYVFLLTKSQKYFYDWAATLQAPGPDVDVTVRGSFKRNALVHAGTTVPHQVDSHIQHGGSRLRDVWWLSVGGFKGAHFATYPVSLPLICIAAGTPKHVCKMCGKPWTHEVTKTREATRPGTDTKIEGLEQNKKTIGVRDPARHVTTVQSDGWKQSCGCGGAAGRKRATVLDPFGGAGTTAIAAAMLGRNSVCIELNKEYSAMAEKRLMDWYAAGGR